MTDKKHSVSNQDIEAILLSAEGSLELIEKRLLKEIEDAKADYERQNKVTAVTDFEKVPQDKVFAAECSYKLFNRDTKHEFLINGVQLEARIGLDNALYEKVKSRKSAAFCVENAYVKFDRFLKKGP